MKSHTQIYLQPILKYEAHPRVLLPLKNKENSSPANRNKGNEKRKKNNKNSYAVSTSKITKKNNL